MLMKLILGRLALSLLHDVSILWCQHIEHSYLEITLLWQKEQIYVHACTALKTSS